MYTFTFTNVPSITYAVQMKNSHVPDYEMGSRVRTQTSPVFVSFPWLDMLAADKEGQLVSVSSDV